MTQRAQTFTEKEYLALEAASERKHEFVDGQILAMAGAMPAHNILAARMTTLLGNMIEDGHCVVLTSDQRVHVPATGLYTYPDVAVACGERRYDGNKPAALLNPLVLVEVTSDSTEEYDRGAKFVHYQAIASLREYLIVSHRERKIEIRRRLDTGEWLLKEISGDDAVVELPSLRGRLRLADVYRKVDLTEGAGS